MALRVGSAMAWKTSLLILYLQPFDCKYKRNHSIAQIYFSDF
jgi:hypothetical protein